MFYLFIDSQNHVDWAIGEQILVIIYIISTIMHTSTSVYKIQTIQCIESVHVTRFSDVNLDIKSVEDKSNTCQARQSKITSSSVKVGNKAKPYHVFLCFTISANIDPIRR